MECWIQLEINPSLSDISKADDIVDNDNWLHESSLMLTDSINSEPFVNNNIYKVDSIKISKQEDYFLLKNNNNTFRLGHGDIIECDKYRVEVSIIRQHKKRNDYNFISSMNPLNIDKSISDLDLAASINNPLNFLDYKGIHLQHDHCENSAGVKFRESNCTYKASTFLERVKSKLFEIGRVNDIY